MSGVTPVGQIAIPNTAPNQLLLALNGPSSLVVITSGIVNYSGGIPAIPTGSVNISNSTLNITSTTFSNIGGQDAVTFNFSFSGILPTANPTITIASTISGSIQGLVTAVPEPSSVGALALLSSCALAAWRRRQRRNERSIQGVDHEAAD